jgi:hypothetical protein
MFTPFVPTTGLAGYRSIESTKQSQLAALREDPATEREIAYFKENIGSVRSASDLVQDRRLLQVAMTAFGLESELEKTAFIEQALAGGVIDEDSFANRLSDKRWTDFVGAVAFEDPNAGFEIPAFRAAVELKFRKVTPLEHPVSQLEINGFRAGIDNIQSIDDLLADATTMKVALTAFGLERDPYTDAHFHALINGGTDDPESYANLMHDTAWADFANAFEGLADGDTMEIRSGLHLSVGRELARRGVTVYTAEEANGDTGKITEEELSYFQQNIDAITSVSDLVNDDTLLKVSKIAFGLSDEDQTKNQITAILDAAVSGDMTVARSQENFEWYRLADAVAASINGDTATRMEYMIEIAIAGAQLEEPLDDPETPSIDPKDLDYFNQNFSNETTAAQLIADERMLNVALSAFGLDDEGKSTSFIQTILEEDPNDRDSLVHYLSDDRWVDFARAFQPSADGDVKPALLQYAIEERLIAIGAPQKDLDYVRRNFDLIDSNLDFVLDPALMDITMSAFGLPKDSYGNTFFLNAILSDPRDENSFVNRFGDERFIAMSKTIGAFAGANGRTGLTSFIEDITARYVERSFETAVGNIDQNLRLALNFAREIQDVAAADNVESAGWYQIMAQKPLRRVIDAGFGLPTEFAQLDLDAQLSVYKNKSRSMFGGEHASVFADTNNVVEILTRFLSMSTDNNLSSAPGYGALTLLNQTAAFAQSNRF